MNIRFLRMLSILLTFCFFSSFSSNSKEKEYNSYILYHETIRDIENSFFGRNDTFGILNKYVKLFECYDFLYLQDCMTAAQLAIYLKNESLFLYFTEKASLNGLSQESLLKFKYITNSSFYLSNFKVVNNYIVSNRIQYLKRINKELLKEVIKIYAKDQSQKNIRIKDETVEEGNKRYKSQYSNTRNALLQLIKLYGFPSDKLIGVDQKDLMAICGEPNSDLLDYYKIYKDISNVSINQYIIEDNVFASTYLIPLMWHGKCSYDFLKPFLNDEMRKGNLHPRDIAIIKDEDYRSKILCENSRIDSVYFNMGDEKLLDISDTTINKNRFDNYICFMEADKNKLEFEKKYKMILRYGFLGKR